MAGVSREKGVEHTATFERSVNSDKFVKFLEQLTSPYKAGEVVLFLDNLSVHHSKIVQQYMKDNQLEALFNVPYSPDYNPIENVFNLLK